MGGWGSTSKPPPYWNNPRSFYVVQGSPQIRYKYDNKYGPLIYHAEMESTEAERMVERADSFQLTAAVPSKQSFLLVPRRDGPAGSADLTFEICMAKPIKRLSVYANMSVSYVENKGLVLRSVAETPHNPACVYDESALSVAACSITTTSPVFYTSLCAASFTASLSGHAAAPTSTGESDGAPQSQHIKAAPLVIVMELPEMDSKKLPSLGAKQDATKTESNASDSPRRRDASTAEDEREDENSEVQTAPTRHSLPSQTQSQRDDRHEKPIALARVLHLTFLDFDASSQPLARASAEGDAPAHQPSTPVKMRVVKQLLQLGSEVYELDDIFDLGNGLRPAAGVNEDGAAASQEDDSSGMDDENLCVVCLSNPKDTAILPCRHMCVCNDCAAQLRLNNNKCPVCRCNIERVLTM